MCKAIGLERKKGKKQQQDFFKKKGFLNKQA
jgi:hypothetical protein